MTLSLVVVVGNTDVMVGKTAVGITALDDTTLELVGSDAEIVEVGCSTELLVDDIDGLEVDEVTGVAMETHTVHTYIHAWCVLTIFSYDSVVYLRIIINVTECNIRNNAIIAWGSGKTVIGHF